MDLNLRIGFLNAIAASVAITMLPAECSKWRAIIINNAFHPHGIESKVEAFVASFRSSQDTLILE
jgi:hypothetical protein